MKRILTILIIAIIALCCVVAKSDPPPTGDQSQVFSPDEIILIESTPSVQAYEIRSLDATTDVLFVSYTNVTGIVHYPELVVDTNAFDRAEYISSLIANGEIVFYKPDAVSKTTGEPLEARLSTKASNVPDEVLSIPQYTEGATWRMTYTSAGTNYFLVKTIAQGYSPESEK